MKNGNCKTFPFKKTLPGKFYKSGEGGDQIDTLFVI